MKKTWKTACALSSAVCLLVVTQAMGQLTQPRNPGQGALERGAAEREATGQKFNLASKLTKMNVKDSANQTIGQIQDLLIDESGQVQYVAIAVQGAAAGTERLQPRTPGARSDQPGARPEQPSARLQPSAREEVADARMSKITLVPYEAVEFHDGATAAQAYVMLSIDKDRFTQAPTFTVQQITAQGGQATWMTQVDQFFERDKSGAARPDLNRPNPNNRDPRSPRTPNRTTPDREDDNRGAPDRDDDNRGINNRNTEDREDNSAPRIPKPERDE